MKKQVLLLLALLLFLLPASAAGEVTDTLSVYVGYWGMDTDRYCSVGSWHWSELESLLPLHQQAYSFFRAGESGDFKTVIDAAYGFYLEDLLALAGVDPAALSSMSFYTKDQEAGYFTSFTYSELFASSRYYFSDLAAKIRPLYDEDGNFLEYDARAAWDGCSLVRPMLALEDNWVSFEAGTEYTAPDFSNLSTSSRFRLLFGQSHPLEMRSNQSAKYTHTVYLTLAGAPEIDPLPEPESEIGTHTLQFSVRIPVRALRERLQELLQLRSSDEDVLRITGWTVTPSAQYSDVAIVELEYEVLRSGAVSLSAAVGGQTLEQIALEVPEPTEPSEPSDNTEPTEPSEPEDPSDEVSAPTDESISESQATDAGKTEQTPDRQQAPSQPADGEQPSQPAEEEQPPQPGEPDAPPDEGQSAAAEAEPQQASGLQVRVLGKALAAQLGKTVNAEPEQPKDSLTVPETASERTTLLLLPLCVLLGAATTWFYYKKEKDTP